MNSDAKDDTEVGQDLETLGERWGFVVVTHRPERDDDFRWMVANHTDEGLGPRDSVHARGETLSEAIDNALSGNVHEW